MNRCGPARASLDADSTPVNRPSELTYTPAWWVRGPHLHTLWGRIARRTPPVATRSERWATPDDDEIEVCRLDASRADAPRLLLLHGLEGTIRSHYLQGTLALAQARGWAADVMIFRGCNGEANRARRLYHSGETTDVDFVARRLMAEHPEQPLVVAGFSLGGNVLLKWLGEQGDALPAQLRAAAAMSVPYDLEAGSRHIERGFSRVYNWHFLRTLRRKAESKLRSYPDAFDAEALVRAKTLFEFDDVVTAPLHGFRDAHDYYTRSSARHFLGGIRRPTLLLSSADDPFMPRDILNDVFMVARKNPHLDVEMHELGGHVGFVSGLAPLSSRFYGEERMIEFLTHQLDP